MANSSISAVQTYSGQVKTSASDPTLGYLGQKLVAGHGLNLDESGVGGKTIQAHSFIPVGADTGSANQYAVTTAVPLTAYFSGMSILLLAGNTNTGASVLNINSIGNKNIYFMGSTLEGCRVRKNRPHHLVYDGTQFHLLTDYNLPGTIKPWVTNVAPSGTVFCDGSALSPTTYADLYSVVGTQYGGGTTDTCTGGTAISGGYYSTQYPSLAFDNNVGTYWGSSQIAANQYNAAYIGYNFGSGNEKAVRVINIRQYSGPNGMPLVKIQYSDNGTVWNDVGTYTLNTYGGLNTLALPSSGTHRYWRALAWTNLPSGNVWAVFEIEMGLSLSTFLLPDLRGRSLFGKDDMGGSAAGRIVGDMGKTLGGVGGEENHTLTQNEMPTHSHPPYTGYQYFWEGNTGGASYAPSPGGSYTFALIQTTGNTGGGATHNNMPPCSVVNWVMYY